MCAAATAELSIRRVAIKSKGFYRYISKKTGRFVAKGNPDSKRVYALRSLRSPLTGRFLPKTVAQSVLNTKSEKIFYLGALSVGFEGSLRYCYNIPFRKTKSGLEIDQNAIQKAIDIEVKKDQNAIVLAVCRVEVHEDRGTGTLIWFRTTDTFFADEKGGAKKIIRTSMKAINGSNVKRLLEINIQFTRISRPVERPGQKNREAKVVQKQKRTKAKKAYDKSSKGKRKH